jgi:hypothetical protein
MSLNRSEILEVHEQRRVIVDDTKLPTEHMQSKSSSVVLVPFVLIVVPLLQFCTRINVGHRYSRATIHDYLPLVYFSGWNARLPNLLYYIV